MDTQLDAIAAWIATYVPGMSAADVRHWFATPPKAEQGDLAVRLFQHPEVRARTLKPDAAATALATKLAADPDKPEIVRGVEAAGAFVNLRWAPGPFADAVLAATARLAAGDFTLTDGHDDSGAPRVVTLDFSSPNVAKEFSLGHLRSTALGWAVHHLYEACGYDVVGINHLGDWGTQFGILIHAYREEGDEAAMRAQPLAYLQALYQKYTRRQKVERAKQRSDAAGEQFSLARALANKGEPDDPDKAAAALADDPKLAEPVGEHDPRSVTSIARDLFKLLEAGDPEVRKLWQLFRDVSVAELRRVYELLGITFDHWQGESFFEDKMQPVLDDLERQGLLVEDRAPDAAPDSPPARVVPLPGKKKSKKNKPAIMVTPDGRTTYATRDVAAVRYRHERFGFTKNVYVVDARQTDHFAEVFGVVRALGHEYADACEHVPFGIVTVGELPMSTRHGNVILMQPFLVAHQPPVVAHMKAAGREALAENADLIHDIAIGAILFGLLRVDRLTPVKYAPDEVTSFAGETGPRVMYLHARLCSVQRECESAGFGNAPHLGALADVDVTLLRAPEEQALLRALAAYPEKLRAACREHQPQVIARYLLELATQFNRYWESVPILPKQPGTMKNKAPGEVTEEERAIMRARLVLVDALRGVVAKCLGLLGMAAPQAM